MTVFAHRFQQDCIRFLSKQKCNLPHKISLKYFPYKKHPDRRGYAELWGRKDVIQWADVQIADYLQSSVYKESLLVTVYHELFHAWFDLDHTEDGISIMNSVAYYDVDLLIENDFDFYLSKEFERVKYKH